MVATPPAAELFAIILAGGASSRLHATSPRPVVDKPLLEFEGQPLITRVLTETARVVLPQATVVVGPSSLPTGKIPTVSEDPPQAGPYLAVRTGLQHFTRNAGASLEGQGVLLLAADMPWIGLGINALAAHHRDTAAEPQVAIIEADGHVQPLLSYVPRTLADQLFAEPILNAGIWQALRDQSYRRIELANQAGADIDTYQDAVNHGIVFTDQNSLDRGDRRV